MLMHADLINTKGVPLCFTYYRRCSSHCTAITKLQQEKDVDVAIAQ